MPLDDLEVIRDQYSAVNERDFRRAMSHYAEDVELMVNIEGIRAGTVKGVGPVGRWFGDWFSTFDRDARFDITELTELADGLVLVVADHRARGRASGVEVNDQVVWLNRMRDGKIARLEQHPSRRDAVEAAERTWRGDGGWRSP
jgi:ketosteroid isomerase-like protein